MGKQRRVKFSSNKHTSTGILEYIHSNLWSPTRFKSHSGCKGLHGLVNLTVPLKLNRPLVFGLLFI